MRVEKAPNVKPRKWTVTRMLKLALPLLVVLMVLLLLLAPAFISSETGRRMILAKINGAVAGKADFDDLSMGWFKGIKVANPSFNDDAGEISVRAEQLSTRPAYSSILIGNLSLGKTVIDKPRVEVNVKERQGSDADKAGEQPSSSGEATSVVLPIKTMDLVVNDGSIKVTDPKSGTVELSQINSRVNLQPPPGQSGFDVKMVVARAGKVSEIKATGNVATKSKKGWSLKGTSGDLTVEVKDLDLESLGPIFALAGIEVEAKGVVNGTAKGQIKEGRFENLTTGITAKNLDVAAAQLKGDRLQTAALDVTVKLSQGQETINVEALKVESDFASVAATGTVPTSFKTAGDFLEADSGYDLKGDFNCDLAALAAQMPRTLGLKEGTQITAGRLTGNVETVTTGGKRQIQADAIVAGLRGTVEGKKTALSESIRAEALVSSDKSGITFDKLDVSAPFATVSCTGRIESLKYDVGADLAKLQSELGQFVNIGKYKMAGELVSNGQVSVMEDRITASGSSTVTNLFLSSVQDGNSVSEPMADIGFAVSIDKKTNILAIDSAGVSASFGRVDVSNCVVPLDANSTQPRQATISARNVDLAKLLPFGVMFGSLPKEMQLSGIADSTLSVAVDKGIYKLATDSTRIDGLRLRHPDREKPFEPNYVTLAFDAEIGPEGATNVKDLELLSPIIEIRKGRFSRVTKGETTMLAGNAELEYDWSAVSDVAAPYLPEGLKLEGRRQDIVDFSSAYLTAQPDQLLPNLSAQARLGFDKASYKGLNLGPTDVEIRMQSGVLNIPPFTTTANEGQFSFAGQIDFNEKEPLFRIAEPMQIVKDVKINDEITGKLLKYVNPIFADAVNVSGFANFNCEQLAIPLKSESKNRAVAIGTISMGRVRLQGSNLMGQILKTSGGDPRGTDMAINPTRFALQKGFLRYDDMQIDIGDNPVNFKGVIGLDKSLAMTATLPYTTEGRTARVGRETSGRRISLPIKGTVDAPELDMGKLIEQQLKGTVDELIQKGLEDIFK